MDTIHASSERTIVLSLSLCSILISCPLLFWTLHLKLQSIQVSLICLMKTSVKTSVLYSYSFGLPIRSRNTETCILITGVNIQGLIRQYSWSIFNKTTFWGTKTALAHTTVGSMTGRPVGSYVFICQASRLMKGCVKVSLPSFPDNPIVQVFHISQANFYESPILTMCIAHIKATSSLVLWALSKTLTVASKHCS